MGAGSTGPFTPKTATPGANVTLVGKAKPNTAMSGYFSCDAGCGEYHVGVAKVGANGSYSLTFQVPLGAKLGAARVAVGCDACGNGWQTVKGLTIVAPPPPPQADPAKTKIINQSYQITFGRDPTAEEMQFWQKVPAKDPVFTKPNGLIENLRWHVQRAITESGVRG